MDTPLVEYDRPYKYMDGVYPYPKVGAKKIALEQVNFIREAMAIGEGKLPKLPRGISGDPKHCVLARALSNGWVATASPNRVKLYHGDGGVEVDFKVIAETLKQRGFRKVNYNSRGEVSFQPPQAMTQLMDMFDNNMLPSLEMTERQREKAGLLEDWETAK